MLSRSIPEKISEPPTKKLKTSISKPYLPLECLYTGIMYQKNYFISFILKKLIL